MHQNIEFQQAPQKICHQRKIRALYLEVDRHNPRARELYTRVGFEAGDRILMTQQFR